MNIPYLLFKKVTKNFSEERIIGKGGFGTVYKGELDNGELIAVKMLHPLQGLDDGLFKNEVCNNLFHPNIIGLLGYCDEIHSEFVEHNGEKVSSKHVYRGLCFEYFPNGSLHKHLAEQSLARNWSTRYNIIKGICQGLNFLHECKPSIFHLDLKPDNILMDNSMLPKLADFGLSRLFRESHSQVTQQRIGTDKYMPPEYRNGGKISEKYDVFSLGVVMTEIMEGYSLFQEMDDVTQIKQEVLAKWSSMIEPTAKYRPQLLLQVKMCINIAMSCVDSERRNRPTIATVLATMDETEAQLPSKQLAVQALSPTVNFRNSLAETLKMMRSELDSINISATNMEQVPDIREAPSNVEEPLIIEEIENRETSSYVEEGLIIGRTEERKKILSILSESSTMEMVILPIYGIGGIGKTTLTQLVFSDTQFSGYSQVWVYVSEHLDLYKIGNSIISQLSKGDSNIENMQIIHNQLRQLFADKRILIVLDDLWEDKPRELDKLKAMLSLGKGKKVILVTTRDEAIARKICSTVENVPYKLQILTDDMCWVIIKQKSGFENQPAKKHLEHIGRDIAIKCGGVALAAQSVGYMLRDMTIDQWESVRDSDIWNLSTSEDPSLTTHEVLASLRLSYSHMHKFLRMCFSYCAVFPKGHIIAKYDLIHQWIALGFPQSSEIFDLMQLCEQYITQLLGMSFLQYSNTPLGEPRQDNDATYFMMHDLVHDLARAMLADKVKENANVRSNSQYALVTGPLNMPLQSFLRCPKDIKALHFLHSKNIELHESAISAAESLVILELSGCFIERLPESVGQLKQLRYLSAQWIEDRRIPTCLSDLSKLNYLCLRNGQMKALPHSIGDLKGLMYLDLSCCEALSELPESFADLKQLVHLDLSCCRIPISESLGSLGSFTKLQHLNLSQSSFFLWKLTKKQEVKVLAEVIGKLTRLQYLNLSFSFRDHIEVLTGPEVFGKLTKLRYLNLKGCMRMTSEADIYSLLVGISALYNLEHLNLSDSRLRSIPESFGNLTKLHTLDITNCKIQKFPAWMVKMASLKIINMTTLDDCSSNLILIAATNSHKMKISELEDVKSLEEAQSIKLIEKRRMADLKLKWTLDCDTRFVDDKDVLELLVPPNTIRYLAIKGYMSPSFPTNWLMCIGQYLPSVISITLADLPNCNNLPPLSQLRKLKHLYLYRLESLEELNTVDSCGELMFPNLEMLDIRSCPMLRLKPCLPSALLTLLITTSDNMLTSWGECVSQTSSSSSYPRLYVLKVEASKVPLYQWRLLQHVFAQSFIVRDCSDHPTADYTLSPGVIQCLSLVKSLDLKDDIMTELPTWLLELTSLQELSITLPKLEKLNDRTRQLMRGLWSLTLRGCRSMVSLPQWLGELTSLKEIDISRCKGIRSLPGSIRQLTKLEILQIDSDYMYWFDLEKVLSSMSSDTDEVDIEKLIEIYKISNSLEGSDSYRDEEDIEEHEKDKEEESIKEDIEEHNEEDYEESTDYEELTEEDTEEDIEEDEEDINNNGTSADAHGGPGVDTAPVANPNATALIRSPSAALSIESGSAIKSLSDSPPDDVNASTHENVTNKRRFGAAGRAGPIIVEAPGRAEKRPRHLVPDMSTATTNSLDTSSGSSTNNSAADVLIPKSVVATVAATDMEDLIRSFSALSLTPAGCRKLLVKC